MHSRTTGLHARAYSSFQYWSNDAARFSLLPLLNNSFVPEMRLATFHIFTSVPPTEKTSWTEIVLLMTSIKSSLCCNIVLYGHSLESRLSIFR